MIEGGDATCDEHAHAEHSGTMPTQTTAIMQRPQSVDGNPVQSIVPVDPLAPDAPILHLLSLRENPNVATMSEDELRALVQRLRTMATSPQTLSAELSKESSRANPRQRNSISAKRKALLDSI